MRASGVFTRTRFPSNQENARSRLGLKRGESVWVCMFRAMHVNFSLVGATSLWFESSLVCNETGFGPFISLRMCSASPGGCLLLGALMIVGKTLAVAPVGSRPCVFTVSPTN